MNRKLFVQSFRLIWQYKKSLFFFILMENILAAASSFLTVLLPKLIVDELTYGHRINCFIGYVLCLVGSIFICSILIKILKKWNALACQDFSFLCNQKLFQSASDSPYILLSDPEFINKYTHSHDSIGTKWGLAEPVVHYGTILQSLLVIASISLSIIWIEPWLFLVIILSRCIQFLLEKKISKKDYELEQLAVHSTRKADCFSKYMTDFQYGKEIRLYHFIDVLLKEYKENKTKKNGFCERQNYLQCAKVTSNGVLALLEKSATYLFLSRIGGIKVSLGNFYFISSGSEQLSNALTSAFSAIVALRQVSIRIDEFLELTTPAPQKDYLEMPDLFQDNWTIRFENVTFIYPNTIEPALNNINITIHANDRIAIVGENGAGKTTFIKLLLGLYTPTQGHIYLNNCDITHFNPQDYRAKIAPVFQDSKLFALSIKDNIVLQQSYQEEKLNYILQKVGMDVKIKELPNHLDTMLFRAYDDNGIELSGGQAQKCAVARALYRDAAVFVLDEPTSAMDPISEHNLYTLFDQMTQGKTVLFISHRLSSVQFSDKIFVFENHGIVENGTHIELLAQNGFYAKLYQYQSQFYNI